MSRFKPPSPQDDRPDCIEHRYAVGLEYRTRRGKGQFTIRCVDCGFVFPLGEYRNKPPRRRVV